MQENTIACRSSLITSYAMATAAPGQASQQHATHRHEGAISDVPMDSALCVCALCPCGHYTDRLKRVIITNMIKPLNTKRRLLYLKTHFVPRSKHFSSRL